ncbi:MAG: OmpA family protein [Burkholderiaceae bacterium]
MSDKDENREENVAVAIILSFAVVLAIAVSFWAAFSAISLSGKPAAASAASVSTAAPAVTAPTTTGSAAAGSADTGAAAASAPAAGTAMTAGAAMTAAAAIAGPVKLYFDTGRNDLPADAASELAPIVEAVKSGRADRAVVSGFHDKTGSADVNAEISKARALAVAAALRAAGLSDAQIDLRKPQETTGDGNDREARRVEVTAEKG